MMVQQEEQEKAALVDEIVSLHDPIYKYFMMAHAEAWSRLRLTMLQFKVLASVSVAQLVDSPRVQRQLGILPSTLTRVVDQLVRQGLVERTEQPPDRRIVYLRCTPKGRSLVCSLTNLGSLASLTSVLRDLPGDELRTLRDGLVVLGKAVAKAGQNPRP